MPHQPHPKSNHIQNIQILIILPTPKMPYIAQIITNSILQEIPAISLTFASGTLSKKYLFNIPQQHSRHARRHYHVPGYGMSLFFTRFNTDTLAGLSRYLLELNITVGKSRQVLSSDQQYKCFNTKIYLNNSSFIFWKAMKKQLGFRLLPYAFYNYDTGEELLGLRNVQQNRMLYKNSVYQWIRGSYTSQQLNHIVGNPSKASEFMLGNNKQANSEKQDKTAWIYNDSMLEVRTFKISDPVSQPNQAYYNHLCIPIQYRPKINKQKIDQLCKQNPQFLTKTLFTSGTLTLSSGTTINLSQIQQPHQQHSCLLILHYKTKQHLQQIKNNPHLNQYISQLSQKKQYIKYLIHVIQGNGEILFSDEFREFRLKFGDVQHVICNKYCRDYGGHGEKYFRQHMLSMYPHFVICQQVKKYGFWANIIDNVTGLYLKFAQAQVMQRMQNRQKTANRQKQGIILWERTNYELCIAPYYLQKYRQVILPTDYIKKPPKPVTKINIPPNLTQQQSRLKQKLQTVSKISNPTIIFLGTSSMRSINERNVSGIVIKFQDQHKQDQFSVLLDCGDGILDQFNNHFGLKYEEELLKLKVVFLSHMHQDHCAGLFHFLAKRNAIVKRQVQEKNWDKYRMFVIIPENMVQWYETYNKNTQRLDQFNDLIIAQSIFHPDVGPLIRKLSVQKVSVFSKNKTKKPQISNKQHETVGEYKGGLFSKLQKQQRKQNTKVQTDQQKLKENERIDNLLNRCFSSQDIDEQVQTESTELAKILQLFSKTHEKNIQKFRQFLENKKLTKFTPVPVYHCRQSYGIIIEHKSIARLAFSGDCRPTLAFIKMAKNSTLLIHQATFQSYKLKRAKQSNHSTTAQAIQIGFNTNSLITMLTHFANQNSNNHLQESIEQINKVIPKVTEDYIRYQVGRASDHLEFKLSEMYKLPRLRYLI